MAKNSQEDQVHAIAKIVEGLDLSSLGDEVDSGGYDEIFPILSQTVKNERFVNSNDEVAESYNGKASVVGVMLGTRFSVIGYPNGFIEGADKQDDPVFGGAAPAADKVQRKAIKDGSNAYQFTPRDEKGKFDRVNDGPGLAKPSLEILIWTEKEGIIVLKSASHYVSVYKAGWSLQNITKVKRGLPIKFTGAMKPNNGIHLPVINTENVAEDLRDVFLAFLKSAGPEVHDDIERWLRCDDNPLREDDLAALEASRALNPPRG